MTSTDLTFDRTYLRRIDEAAVDGEECPQNLELRWMTEVQSSVYATPLITDLFSDGHKDIVVPSFVHHLEVPTPLVNHCSLLPNILAVSCMS